MNPSPGLAAGNLLATAAGGERMPPPTLLANQEPCGGKDKTPRLFPKPTRLPKTFAALTAGVGKKRSNNSNRSINREDATAADGAENANGSSCDKTKLDSKGHVTSIETSCYSTTFTEAGTDLGREKGDQEREREQRCAQPNCSSMDASVNSNRKSTTPETVIDSRRSSQSSVYHDLDFTRDSKDDEISLRSTDLSDSSSLELSFLLNATGGGGHPATVKSTSVSPSKPIESGGGSYHHSRPSCGMRIIEMRASRKQKESQSTSSSPSAPFCTTKSTSSSLSNAHGTNSNMRSVTPSETIDQNDVVSQVTSLVRYEGEPLHRSSLDLNVTYVEHFDERPLLPEGNRISLDSDMAASVSLHEFASNSSNSSVGSLKESKTSSASSSSLHSLTNSLEKETSNGIVAPTTNDVGGSSSGVQRKQLKIAALRKPLRLHDLTTRLTKGLITRNAKQLKAVENCNMPQAGPSDSPSCKPVQAKHDSDCCSRRQTSSSSRNSVSTSTTAESRSASRSGSSSAHNSIQSRQHSSQSRQHSSQSKQHSLQSGQHSLQSRQHSLQTGFNDSSSSSDDSYSPANSSTDTLIDSIACETSLAANDDLDSSSETDTNEQQHSTSKPSRTTVDARLQPAGELISRLQPSGESVNKHDHLLSRPSQDVSNPSHAAPLHVRAGKSTSSLHSLGFRKVDGSSQARNLTLSTSCLTQKNAIPTKHSPPVSYLASQKLKNIQRIENFGRASDGMVVRERQTLNLPKANSSSDLYRTTNAIYRPNTTFNRSTNTYTVNEGLIQNNTVQNSKLKIPVSTVQISTLNSSYQVAALKEGHAGVSNVPSVTSGAKCKKKAAAVITAVGRSDSSDSQKSIGYSKQQHSPAIPVRILPSSAAAISPVKSYRQPTALMGNVGRRLATTTKTTNRFNPTTPENLMSTSDHLSSKPLSPISEKQNPRSGPLSQIHPSIPASVGETAVNYTSFSSSSNSKHHPRVQGQISPVIGVHHGLPKSATPYLRSISAQHTISMSKIPSTMKSNTSPPVADGASIKPDLRQRPIVAARGGGRFTGTTNLFSGDVSEISQSQTSVFTASSSSSLSSMVVTEFSAAAAERKGDPGGRKLSSGSCFALNVSSGSSSSQKSISSSIAGGGTFSKQRKGSTECVKIDRPANTDSVKIDRSTNDDLAKSLHSIVDCTRADGELEQQTISNSGRTTDSQKQSNLRTAGKSPLTLSSKLRTPTNFVCKKSSNGATTTHDTVKEEEDESLSREPASATASVLLKVQTAPLSNSFFTQLQLKHVKPYTSSASNRGASFVEKFTRRQCSADGQNKTNIEATNSLAKTTDRTCQLENFPVAANQQVGNVEVHVNTGESVTSTTGNEITFAKLQIKDIRLEGSALSSREESSSKTFNISSTDKPVYADDDDVSHGKQTIIIGPSIQTQQQKPETQTTCVASSSDNDVSKIEFEEMNNDLLNAWDSTNDNETNESGAEDVTSSEYHLTQEKSVNCEDYRVNHPLPVLQHQSHSWSHQTNGSSLKAQRKRSYDPSYQQKNYDYISSDTDYGSGHHLNRLSGGDDEFSSEAECFGSLDRFAAADVVVAFAAAAEAADDGHEEQSLNGIDQDKTIPGTTASEEEVNCETFKKSLNSSSIRQSRSSISRCDEEKENMNYCRADCEIDEEDLERLTDDRTMDCVSSKHRRQDHSSQKTLTDAESQCEEIFVPSSNRNSLGLPENILLEQDDSFRDIEKFVVTYESDNIIVLERANSLQISNCASQGIDPKTAVRTAGSGASSATGSDSSAAATLRRTKDGLLMTKCSDLKATTSPRGSEPGNLPLSESGYDSWKSQSSKSSTRFLKPSGSDNPVAGSVNCFQETFVTSRKKNYPVDGHNCQPIRECFYDHSSLESEETPRESLIDDVTSGNSFDEFPDSMKLLHPVDDFSYERNARISSSVSASSFQSSGSSFMGAFDSSSNSLFLTSNAECSHTDPRSGIIIADLSDSSLIRVPSFSSSSFEQKDLTSRGTVLNGGEYSDYDQMDTFEETTENSSCELFNSRSAFDAKDYHNRIYKLDFGSADGELTLSDEQEGSFKRIPFSNQELSLQTRNARHSSCSKSVAETKNSQSDQLLRPDQERSKDSKSQSRSGFDGDVHCLTFPLTNSSKPLSDAFQRDGFHRPKEMLAKALAESCAGLLNSSSKTAAASKKITRETYYENVCDELLEGFEANLSDSDHTSSSPVDADLEEDGPQKNDYSFDSSSLLQSQSSPELLDQKIRDRIISHDDGVDLKRSVASSRLDALDDNEETGSQRRSSDITGAVQSYLDVNDHQTGGSRRQSRIFEEHNKNYQTRDCNRYDEPEVGTASSIDESSSKSSQWSPKDSRTIVEEDPVVSVLVETSVTKRPEQVLNATKAETGSAADKQRSSSSGEEGSISDSRSVRAFVEETKVSTANRFVELLLPSQLRRPATSDKRTTLQRLSERASKKHIAKEITLTQFRNSVPLQSTAVEKTKNATTYNNIDEGESEVRSVKDVIKKFEDKTAQAVTVGYGGEAALKPVEKIVHGKDPKTSDSSKKSVFSRKLRSS